MKGLLKVAGSATLIILSRKKACLPSGWRPALLRRLIGGRLFFFFYLNLDCFSFTGIEAGHKPISDLRKLKQLSLQVCISVILMMDLC